MKILAVSCLFAALLNTVVAFAQGFAEKQSAIKSYRILRADFERPLDKVEMYSFDRQSFRSQEDSLLRITPARSLYKWRMRWENFLGSPREGGRFTDQSISSSPLGQMQNLSGEVQEAWARHYAAGLAPSLDLASAMTVDAAGNVYVTGFSSGLPFGLNYLTIKYNAAGAQVWTARYNGPNNGDDWASAIYVDASGNVYVTGASYDSATSEDYATIKYNSAGVEQWVARYNGPGNLWDEAVAIAVDVAGNVYVAGVSRGAGTSEDYATIKYNSAGVEQWVARHNGPGNSYDAATALAIDVAGNVYVTGSSATAHTGLFPNTEYATIKYNSAGTRQWVVYYNGPESNAGDIANALAVDAAGNVYVTGRNWSSSTGSDYATVKYNSAGVEQWAARYNGPGNSSDAAVALALDATGNVYVTGESFDSGTFSDYATIKYNAAGNILWVARYNSSGNAWDTATNLAVDATSNVYVTGNSGTIKYNAAGVQQWVAQAYFPNALVLDVAGNIYVAGTNGTDYATLKYNNAGAIQWMITYNGPGSSNDQAHALAFDAARNLYVTGKSYNSSTSYDYSTVKYNSAGIQQWAARYNGPANSIDWASALAVDAADNVYVTGWSRGIGYDYATVKYNSMGVVQWVVRYNGPGNGDDYSGSLAVDAAGNVYVAGNSRGVGTGDDYTTIKYNSAGVQQWAAHYNGPGNSGDAVLALAVDATGNVYVTGYSTGSGTGYDYATIKYNNSGVQQWVARYNGTGNSDDYPRDLAVDAAGNVYVAGQSPGVGTDADYATIKYNSAGGQQWVARYNGPGNFEDIAHALAVDVTGNVYVTGESEGTGISASDDHATIKYNSAGIEQWIAFYNGPGNDWDVAQALAVDDASNVYVTGYSERGFGIFSTLWDIYTTIKYAQGITGNLGDVNNDGNCNSTDALIILSFDVGLSIPQDFLDRINAGLGDVNSDNITNSTDALIILAFDAGQQVPFPVCQPASQ